jgi:hypothetical protein
MRWVEFQDSLSHERESWRCDQPWLEHSVGKAGYTLCWNEYDFVWCVTWWHGNRGHWLGNSPELEKAKAICQTHLENMAHGIEAHNVPDQPPGVENQKPKESK